ncbi:hypothetical protein EBZ37_03180 [bacterium]|nr:hypothetical protein [bacterium]
MKPSQRRLSACLGVLLAAAPLPFLPQPDEVVGRSVLEPEKGRKQSEDRSTGADRPGSFPQEAVAGSHSGTTVGRPENLWGTEGKMLHGDELQ